MSTANDEANRVPDISAIVRRTAQRLRRTYALRLEARADLEQSLWRRLYERADVCDTGRGTWRQFATVVIRCAAVTMVRHAKAQRREASRVLGSFDEEYENADGDSVRTLEEALVSSGQLVPGDAFAEADLRIDIGRALEDAPPELATLCELLEGSSLSEAARRLGVPRTTLHGRREELREHLLRHGVGPGADVSTHDDVHE